MCIYIYICSYQVFSPKPHPPRRRPHRLGQLKPRKQRREPFGGTPHLAGSWLEPLEMLDKPWENPGETHRKMGKTLGKSKENGTTVGKPW